MEKLGTEDVYSYFDRLNLELVGVVGMFRIGLNALALKLCVAFAINPPSIYTRSFELYPRTVGLELWKMRSFALAAACLSFLSSCLAKENLTTPLSSHQILPNTFKPPQVFKNANLVRTINLEKGYVRETVNVVIENIDAKEQDTYYIPFTADSIGHVGGLEVRDKKKPEIHAFRSEVVEYDTYRLVDQDQLSSSEPMLMFNTIARPNFIASPYQLLSLLLPNRHSP